MDFRHRVRTTSLQSALPMKLINMEVPKRDIHGPLEKAQDLLSKLGAWEEGGGSQENEKGRGRGMPRT